MNKNTRIAVALAFAVAGALVTASLDEVPRWVGYLAGMAIAFLLNAYFLPPSK